MDFSVDSTGLEILSDRAKPLVPTPKATLPQSFVMLINRGLGTSTRLGRTLAWVISQMFRNLAEQREREAASIVSMQQNRQCENSITGMVKITRSKLQ